MTVVGGVVYVVDRGNSLVRAFSKKSGDALFSFGSNSTFTDPRFITSGPGERRGDPNLLYVTDDHRIQSFSSLDGSPRGQTLGGVSAGAAAGSFNNPIGIFLREGFEGDRSRQIIVADDFNNRVQIFEARTDCEEGGGGENYGEL